jgi:hypothetical protein
VFVLAAGGGAIFPFSGGAAIAVDMPASKAAAASAIELRVCMTIVL